MPKQEPQQLPTASVSQNVTNTVSANDTSAVSLNSDDRKSFKDKNNKLSCHMDDGTIFKSSR